LDSSLHPLSCSCSISLAGFWNPSSGKLRRCCYRRPRATTCISEAPPWHHRPPHQANQAQKPLIVTYELEIPKSCHHQSRVPSDLSDKLLSFMVSYWNFRDLPFSISCTETTHRRTPSNTVARTHRQQCSYGQKLAALAPFDSPCLSEPNTPNPLNST
jgi:hypothetical protein